jgi:hypothetical protein
MDWIFRSLMLLSSPVGGSGVGGANALMSSSRTVPLQTKAKASTADCSLQTPSLRNQLLILHRNRKAQLSLFRDQITNTLPNHPLHVIDLTPHLCRVAARSEDLPALLPSIGRPPPTGCIAAGVGSAGQHPGTSPGG